MTAVYKPTINLTPFGKEGQGEIYNVTGERIEALKGRVKKLASDITNFLSHSNGFAALFRHKDKIFSLPVLKGSEGEKAIEVSQLRAGPTTNTITLDEAGLKNTGIAKSSVTYIDGDSETATLHHRGYTIQELAERASFTEVIGLLLDGKLPDKERLKKIESEIKSGMNLPEEVSEMINRLPSSVHPMNIMSSAIAILENFSPRGKDPKNIKESSLTIIGRTLALTALLNQKANAPGKAINLVKVTRASVVDNFIKMMFHPNMPSSSSNLYKKQREVINKLLILHADHEQNCSTFTGRVVASSQAGPYASTSAAINALYGPLHGGANQKVMEMLRNVRDNVKGYTIDDKVKAVVEAVTSRQPLKGLPKTEEGRLMGFGHRVYKNHDPRADVIFKTCHELFDNEDFKQTLDAETKELLEIATKLEKEARTNEYFKKRNLFPNVDFYSGILYTALKIDPKMFTPMFAAGRIPGWLTHMDEQTDKRGGENKNAGNIMRPRQVYVGDTPKTVDRTALPVDKEPGEPVA